MRGPNQYTTRNTQRTRSQGDRVRSEDYEKLGAFYLGRPVDPATGEDRAEPLLYDAKDLTTHAVIVGMTGSGKTGLGIGLIEEALIDGIPVLAIDPKGDLGNLLLTFPKLQGSDFRPWIDEGAAMRAGETPDAHAESQARAWREGLADWGQSPERIERLAQAAERVLYTPGSTAGVPLSILRALDAPPPALLEDGEALRERVLSSVSGLLGLVGIEADPIQSREHILLSNLVERAWREGRNLDLAALIHQIQKPPIERVGVFELETFFPAAARGELAMRINSLLASPGFAAWLEGEPLDVARMLRATDGRPRLSIVSIAHLGDAERMFVVTLLLGQLVAWMRTQSGSQSLRALLYMDEVFGFFPPTANPPSKLPMLTLLKQARAFGLGCVLSTQNPVDLDYKGLSNCGSWFLGRLQTERDKARVLDGLEGVAGGGREGFDRATLERTLSRLDKRVFLLNNVHEDAPILMRTRWTLSYLAGPLSRAQIKALAQPPTTAQAGPTPGPIAAPGAAITGQGAATAAAAGAAAPKAAATSGPSGSAALRPLIPAEANERFLPLTRAATAPENVVYHAALLGVASVHHANAQAGVDEWGKCILWAPLAGGQDGSPWEGAQRLKSAPALALQPGDDRARYAPLPTEAERRTSWAQWSKQLATAVHRDHPLVLLRSKSPKLVSKPGEEEGAFRGRIADLVREERDRSLEKLRQKYSPKLASLKDRLDRAGERVDRESDQYKDKRNQAALSLGASVIGALFGRKLASATNVGRATSTIRGASRAAQERADIGRAEERVEAVQEQLASLEAELARELAAVEDAASAHRAELESLRIAATKSDLAIEGVMLVWAPAQTRPDGALEWLCEAPV
jgi:Helicase HerA, central domain